ncbi:hypothetical protein Q1695_013157 [Nippostrongylus brasiliensis]|nr:hypothetical protein Q1695_013157 [Nippostrongylus brasiliensis]
MTVFTSRGCQRLVTKFRVINKATESRSPSPPNNFVTQVRYDREGRRIADSIRTEPRAILELRKEELMEREKELIEKMERLKRLKEMLKKKKKLEEKYAEPTSHATQEERPVRIEQEYCGFTDLSQGERLPAPEKDVDDMFQGGMEYANSSLCHNFTGGNITVFYERKFGLCPYYDNDSPDVPINGGLPQKVSLAEHLKRVKQQIQEQIPDENYDGLAVIDLEEWRPLWAMNFGAKAVYRNMSIKLVHEKHPKLSLEKAKIHAEKEFNEAARKFLVETLITAKKLRPNALWGYYIYPFCNAKAGEDEDSYSCSAKAQEYNDELSGFPIQGEHSIVSVNLLNGRAFAIQNLRHIQAVLNETRRIANKRTPPTRFFVYTKIEYDPVEKPHTYYNKDDLCSSLVQSSAYGASGVVVWSSSKNMSNRCSSIVDYVEEMLGPAVLKVRAERRRCHLSRCKGKGVCVLRERQKEINWTIPFTDYDCKCDKGYVGNDCTK